jgi:RimJ/RimL family protein N-acetyltransferase
MPVEKPIMPAPVPAGPGLPPERVAAGPLVLRRTRVEDAAPIAAAVADSLDHLRPWMPWATPEAADVRTQLVRIAEADEMWVAGSGFIYVMAAAGGAGERALEGGQGSGRGRAGELVGTIGLHRRAGDDAVEIGYWIAVAHTRRGYATAAARALTTVGAALPGIRQVEIHCDEANVASAAIPRKLGYRLDRVEPHVREAPGERGRRMIWVWEVPGPAAWARPSS